MNVSGHIWTVGTLLRRLAFPIEPPPFVPWTTTIEDPVAGEIRLTGCLSVPRKAHHLVLLVHGLGGTADSQYMRQAAQAASTLGLGSLRLNLRGADGETGDFYHGGLTTDLRAAVRDLAPRFERLGVLGFSLGGHVALRLASESGAQDLDAVAAVCSPLDLGVGVDSIDRPIMAPYRRYVLGHLKTNYAAIARFRKLPTHPDVMKQVRRLREWDSLTVVPRFGFRDTDDYYRRASVGPMIDRLRCPALLVATEHDPMIPPAAIRPSLERQVKSSVLNVRWLQRGGHVALPPRAHLELGAPESVGPPDDPVTQLLRWLRGPERPSRHSTDCARPTPAAIETGRTPPGDSSRPDHS